MQPCADKMVEIIKWKFSGVNSAEKFPPDATLRGQNGGNNQVEIFRRQ
jgi:hypothetical protein